MNKEVLWIITATHIISACIYTLFIFIGWSSLRKENILLIWFVPIFGPLSAFGAELAGKLAGEDVRPSEIESLTLSEDVYWKTIEKRDELHDIVPLEEALIVGDRITRKKIMLENLLEDPTKNLEILLLARENNDIDTAHYANTTIAKIQRDYQLKVQQLSVAHENDPNNIEILNAYIKTLGEFINSKLIDKFLLKRQRILYGNLLEIKLEVVPNDFDTLKRRVFNSIDLNDNAAAIEASEKLKLLYPHNEETWILVLRVCIATHDRYRLNETIDYIRRGKIEWTSAGKDMVSTWIAV